MISAITNLNQSSLRAQMQSRFQDRIQQFDGDGNGTITRSEFTDAISKFGASEKAEKLFEATDSNGDGELSVDEQNALFNKIEQQVAERISASIDSLPLTQLIQSFGESPFSRLSLAQSQDTIFEQLIEDNSAGSLVDVNRHPPSSPSLQHAINAYLGNIR